MEVRRYTGMSSCACAGPLDIGHSRAGHLAMGTVAAAQVFGTVGVLDQNVEGLLCPLRFSL
jgi:hypothetical protein